MTNARAVEFPRKAKTRATEGMNGRTTTRISIVQEAQDVDRRSELERRSSPKRRRQRRTFGKKGREIGAKTILRNGVLRLMNKTGELRAPLSKGRTLKKGKQKKRIRNKEENKQKHPKEEASPKVINANVACKETG